MRNTYDFPSPCFVLDESKLIKNLELISSVKKKAGVDIILAFKGFAMWGVFPTLLKYIDGATASSLNEVKLCVDEMKCLSHTYCVAYESGDFDEIATNSSHLTFNSLSEYERYISRVPENVSIGLRVNPEWSDVETALYNPANPTSRLGINHKNLKTIPDRVEGLHFHVLCESDSNALEEVLRHFEKKFGYLLHKIKWVNMGGGHLMTKKGYDTDHLITILKSFKERYNVEVILEPGSAFAWETGDLVATVLDIVVNGGMKTAIIDASFTCHMPDCLEMPYRPSIVNASSNKAEGMYEYRLGGVSCLAGDFLETYWFDNPLNAGDRIVFEDMIHYTMVKTSMFNGIKHPSIALTQADGNFRVLREFGYKEYKERLS